jgi:histidinol-phosphatase (PHP family)
MLPADSHVHSEFSWDTRLGDMAATCARAVQLGLPAVAFTEHADHVTWTLRPGDLDDNPHLQRLLKEDGTLTPPPIDVDGYFASLQRCRDEFPDLRIISGLEVGEPHRYPGAVAALLTAGQFDRVLGSLHSLSTGDGYAEPWVLYHRGLNPDRVMRDYLTELPALINGSDVFSVLAHIDYAVRLFPGEFDPAAYEDEFRHALRALTGRALEINTRIPLHPEILGWWRDEGGDAVTFGSDAHLPDLLAHGFSDAAAMAESYGFKPGRHPYDVWRR